jgi:hypothetical protein
MSHNDHNDLPDSGRPTKKAKITSEPEHEEAVPGSPVVNTSDDEEDEQSTPQPAEVRASDLYLDTVSELFYLLFLP